MQAETSISLEYGLIEGHAILQDAQELAKLTVFEEQAFFNDADPIGG